MRSALPLDRMRYVRPAWTTLGLTAAVALAASLSLSFAKPVEVRVDGQPVVSDVPPVTTAKGHVYVPLRPVGNALGAETQYERRSGDIVVTRGDQTMHFKIGSKKAKLDGMPMTLKSAPFRVRGRVMLSLKAVQQAFGVRVKYDKLTSRVDVNTPGVGTIPAVAE
jgi:hypothetical protein